MRQYKVGDQIGGEFTVLGIFGGENQSGMGVVYLVDNRELPRPIVLKTYQRNLDADASRRFVWEARAWINAGAHANIVQAHSVREIAGQLFVAAEYVEPDDEGRNNLTHFLNSNQMQLGTILTWATQFCHGMDYARSRGVFAHHDIKPDNLMISRTGSLKITDFGLAKSVDLDTFLQSKERQFSEREKIISNTAAGSAIGTLPYMAPEQFVNAKGVDHRSDIYSFGIVLYQMATGNRYPYRVNDGAPEVVAEFFRVHATQAAQIVESPLMPIISACLQKEPNRRYQTYDAL